MKTDLKSILKWRYWRDLFAKALAVGESPVRIARSVAIGMFIGLIIPIGFQTIVAAPIAFLSNSNLAFIFLGTLISNPLTIIPLYLLAIRIGEFITATEIPLEKFSELLQNPDMDTILQLGGDSLAIIFTGMFFQGIVYAFVTYIFVLYFSKKVMRSKSAQETDPGPKIN